MRTLLLVPALALTLASASSSRVSAQATGSLPRSTPERQGISSAAILSFVQAADSAIDGMHSVMIVRHGQVVAEGWWAPYAARTPHVLYSLSKSFTSTAVGLAVAEGKLSIDDEVLKYFPDEAPAEPSEHLRAMRVRDLLRMSTGHQTEPSFAMATDSSLRDATWVRRTLAHPVPFKPGTHFFYNSSATYLLSAILQKATGQTVLAYLGPRLFAPLGIESPAWFASPEGITAGAFGMSGRTEDVARLGQLYLQKGMWNGRRLLPEAWVEEATARQTATGSHPRSDWDQGYGYQFWRSRHETYRGDGAFGQFMFVLPQHDAVVVVTSGVTDMQAVMNLVWEKLLPAMARDPLPDDASARSALQARLAALTLRLPTGRPTAPLAARVSGRWYELSENARGIRAVSLDLGSSTPAVLVRTAAGEFRTPIGIRRWSGGGAGLSNGIERVLSAPAQPGLVASGAWTGDSVFTVKLVAPQTAFQSTLDFRFVGDRLRLDAAQQLSFGPPKLPPLEGRAVRGR